jgi:hypothetical protein
MSGEEADKLFDEFEEAMTETKTTSTGLDT